jgi:hypothetical protein
MTEYGVSLLDPAVQVVRAATNHISIQHINTYCTEYYYLNERMRDQSI